jgi:hypothetical protein
VDVFSELEDIGRMLASASVLSMVRQEVAEIMKEGFVVTDGLHQDGGEGYDVVVRCGSDGDRVARRLRSSMPELKVKRISDGIVGLKRKGEDGRRTG